MKRRVVCLVGALALMLSGCAEGEVASQTPEGYLDVPLRYYEEDVTDANTQELFSGSTIEIPQIVGAETEDAQRMNEEMQRCYQNLMNDYEGTGTVEWCEALSMPTETDRYLNAVVTICFYPTYGTYGEVYSWVYDRQTGKEVTLEEALSMAEVDEETLSRDFAAYGKKEGFLPVEDNIDTLAFRMLEDGTPQFLAGVTQQNKDADPWISFHCWTDGTVTCPSIFPIDPKEVTGVYGEEPLFCQAEGEDLSLE